MDISEYFTILKKEKKLFFTLVIVLWLISFFWFAFQPVRFSSTLLLNIGRNANEPSTEYSYDSFYRLQADERFADTLVRWLSNPRIVSDILEAAGTTPELYSEKDLRGMFQAKRLSSQVVEVSYGANSRDAIRGYSDALITTSQDYTESLNATQANWFRVSGSEPIIRDGRVTPFPFLLLSLAGAFFIAFWAVFLRHYFVSLKPEKK